MKFSKIVITLIMALAVQQACAMKKPPMDIQVRANTAMARLGRMSFKTEAERIDGQRMIKVLKDFGTRYPEYLKQATYWEKLIADVASGKVSIDRATGKVIYLGETRTTAEGPKLEQGVEGTEPVEFKIINPKEEKAIKAWNEYMQEIENESSEAFNELKYNFFVKNSIALAEAILKETETEEKFVQSAVFILKGNFKRSIEFCFNKQKGTSGQSASKWINDFNTQLDAFVATKVLKPIETKEIKEEEAKEIKEIKEVVKLMNDNDIKQLFNNIFEEAYDYENKKENINGNYWIYTRLNIFELNDRAKELIKLAYDTNKKLVDAELALKSTKARGLYEVKSYIDELNEPVETAIKKLFADIFIECDNAYGSTENWDRTYWIYDYKKSELTLKDSAKELIKKAYDQNKKLVETELSQRQGGLFSKDATGYHQLNTYVEELRKK